MSNPLQMIARMLGSSMGNPQQMAQQILQQNPQFAAMIRGQNPRQMAEGSLRQMGIDPQQILNMTRPPVRNGGGSYNKFNGG